MVIDSQATSRALADTSLFIAVEAGRPLAESSVQTVAVSMVTIGELRFGVLAATTSVARARRLETLLWAQQYDAIPVDESIAAAWARLRVDLRAAGRRLPMNDSWIAATAIAHGLPVATQDADYDDVPGLTTIRL